MRMERLDRLLGSTGRWSRGEAKRLVREGRVLVDGKPAASADEKYDAEGVSITVDGEPVRTDRFVYIMLHKPAGILSATEDKSAATVLDLLPEAYRKRGLFPVGRLDKDAEGLLLLTDDGQLAHALLSPKKHVDKRYYVRVDGVLDDADRAAFEAGMTLGDALVCLPAGLEIRSEHEAVVTLREGKFHQLKRMLAARGKPVLYLKRLAMGALTLDGALLPGEWRELTEEEIKMLQ